MKTLAAFVLILMVGCHTSQVVNYGSTSKMKTACGCPDLSCCRKDADGHLCCEPGSCTCSAAAQR